MDGSVSTLCIRQSESASEQMSKELLYKVVTK